MSFLTTLGRLLVPEPPVIQERDVLIGPPDAFPDLDTQISAIQRRFYDPRPWRPATVTEALGVPAILGAVSLISNTVGSLSLEAYRLGSLLSDRNEVPRLIVRPNPLTTPRVFFRDTAFYLATRGEAWWWVAKRDERDGTPLSLYPVPPWEVQIEENTTNRLQPTIRWNNREMPNDDMRHLTYLPSESGRGVGPLQLAGVAVSITVESENWAANFFSGALPSIVGTTDQEMTSDELEAMDAQWLEKPNNLPRWLTQGLKLSLPPYDPEKAQLTETRQHEVGNTARMFDMPGGLLEYNMPGASLHYQNDETIWADFQRRCLSPHYLEPIEQEISDLLTRSTVARFNLDQLLRASIKTRADVYEKLIPLNVMTPEEARAKEGLAPGNADFQSIPPAPPQAVPDRLPYQVRSAAVRCERCNKLLAETATPPYRMTCPRCKAVTQDLQERAQIEERPQQPVIIHNHPPNVTVEAPQTTFERGAFQAADMAPIADAIGRQKLPDIRVDVAAPDMTPIGEGMAALADRPQTPTEVHFAQQDPPVVNLPAPVVNVPEQAVPVVDTRAFEKALQELRDEIRAPRTRTLIRDSNNVITGVFDKPAKENA